MRAEEQVIGGGKPSSRQRVMELRDWAAEVGDQDVLAVCLQGLAGDRTALDEALDWHDAWAAIHRPSVPRERA